MRVGTAQFLGEVVEPSQSLYESVLRMLADEIAKTNNSRKNRADLEGLHADLSKRMTAGALVYEDREGFALTQQELGWMSKHDSRLWLDYLLYRYQLRVYPKRRELTEFPLHLLIEPTSICNLRCVMCFQIDSTFTKKPFMGMMPWELFTDIVDQARDHNCHAITLASRGEPTLHKRFGEMLMYISDAELMDLKINTNATKLTEKLIHQILSAGVHEVVFSVDASTKETYERIRVRGKFEQVLRNIQTFNEIRQSHYSDSPTVTRISGVAVEEAQDPDEMYRFWSEHVDQVVIVDAVPRWEAYKNAPTLSTDACGMLWERMYVWYDGTCNPCDFDYKSYLSVGDANDERISEIWRGKRFSELRKVHLDGRRCGVVPCDRCPF